MIEMLGSEQLKEQLYILQYIFPRKKCLFSDLLAILWIYWIDFVYPGQSKHGGYLHLFTSYCKFYNLLYIYTYLHGYLHLFMHGHVGNTYKRKIFAYFNRFYVFKHCTNYRNTFYGSLTV